MNSSTPATSIHHHGSRHGRFSLRAIVAALAVLTAFAGATAVGSAQTTTTTPEGTWRPTRPMLVPRFDHTNTLLFGGRVLSAGGRIPSTTHHASAEIFDSKTNLWTATGSMATARWSHTATLLPDGRVLVAGGFTGTPSGSNSQSVTDTAEIYDPATGTWTTVRPMSVRRALHSAALLPGGRVLVAGGRTCDLPPPAVCNFQAVTTSAEIYDPATNTWAPTGNMNVPRHTTNAALLPDGRVLVPNGFWGQGQPRQEGEWYDPATGTWTMTELTETTHARQGAIRLFNGDVVIAAGFTGGVISEVFDPDTNTWTRPGNVLESGRFNFYFSELPNGKGLIAGGQVPATGLSRTSEVFDPATGTWRPGGTMSYTHGSSSSLSNSWEAVLISSNPFTFEADRAVCGNLCGAVLVPGGNSTGGTEFYIPSCTGIPQGIVIYCTPSRA